MFTILAIIVGLVGMAVCYVRGFNSGYSEGIDDNYPENMV
jgi:hypothetical protein